MYLQLFAESEPVETEPVVATEPNDPPASEPAPEPEPSPEPAPEPKPELKHDTVPLAKYMDLQKRERELKKVLAAQEAEREKLRLVQELVNRGWPEQEAELQASEKVRERQELETIKDRQQDIDIKELSKSGAFYDDADAWKDEIKEAMREYKVDAKRAYMLIRGELRAAEMQTKQEQLALARKQQAPKKVESATAAPVTSTYKLDDVDRKALEGLQKAQPDENWTVEKYWKRMKQEE